MTALGRLTKRPEYLRVAGSGRKWVAPGLVLQAFPRAAETHRANGQGREAASADTPEPPVRLGITVSRKVGNSVQRNRARRRLRAAAKEILPKAGRPGFDYVVIGRQGTLSRPYDALLDDLQKAVTRLNAPKRGGEGGSGGREVSRSRSKPRRGGGKTERGGVSPANGGT